MRRADRLFQIVQFLRGGRLVTARMLSERLEVSERTIYRDIRDLQVSGVPVDGEPGVGYILRSGFDLPPLMFTREEMTALVMGARLVKAWGSARTALAAEEALMKIEAVISDADRRRAEELKVFAPDFFLDTDTRERLDRLNDAIEDRHVIGFGYTKDGGEQSEQTVHPLGLYFWGKVWTLVSWCEMRDDFRTFRVDRMSGLDLLDRKFTPEAGRTLRDYLNNIVT